LWSPLNGEYVFSKTFDARAYHPCRMLHTDFRELPFYEVG
jgi:hypothetical protein